MLVAGTFQESLEAALEKVWDEEEAAAAIPAPC